MAKTKSLLDKAKEVKRSDKRLNKVSYEQIELALAWMQDEVSLTQAATALGVVGTGSISYKLALWLREAYRAGIIKVKVV